MVDAKRDIDGRLFYVNDRMRVLFRPEETAGGRVINVAVRRRHPGRDRFSPCAVERNGYIFDL